MPIINRFPKDNPILQRNVMKRMIQVMLTFAGIALLLFASAGSLNWFYAWVYVAGYMFTILLGALVLPMDLIAERGSRKTNVEKWDSIFTAMMTIGILSIYIVAGLDFRWNWTNRLSDMVHICSAVVFLLGCTLVIRAMYVNHFFSTAVRLQQDRGQTVCSNGPYRFVRHPGYLGMIIYNLATPTLLGSMWAFVPAAAVGLLFAARTHMEDKTLHDKLPGYGEYASSVKYRLFPWIW